MREEPVEVVVDGLTLRGKLFTPSDNKKDLAILFLHGWIGRPNENAAKFLAGNGYTTMTFSLRGHNDSDGKLEDVTRENSLRDVTAAYDFFKTKLQTKTVIIAAGSSYGGYQATLLSSHRLLSAISLRVPANYPDENFSEQQLPQSPDSGNTTLIEWRKQMANFSATKSLNALHNFIGPIQIIEAGEDEVVPHQTVQNYVDAIKDKSKLDYHFMKGWPHSLGDDPARNRQYQELLLNWLERI